jgi:hypothetical protein
MAAAHCFRPQRVLRPFPPAAVLAAGALPTVLLAPAPAPAADCMANTAQMLFPQATSGPFTFTPTRNGMVYLK